MVLGAHSPSNRSKLRSPTNQSELGASIVTSDTMSKVWVAVMSNDRLAIAGAGTPAPLVAWDTVLFDVSSLRRNIAQTIQFGRTNDPRSGERSRNERAQPAVAVKLPCSASR